MELYNKIKSISSFVSAVSLILMVFVVLLQTFTRFVIFYSLPWSEEASRYLFVIMIVSGFNVAIYNGDMIRISVIDNYIHGRMKKIIDYVKLIISMNVIFIFSYCAYKFIQLGVYQLSPAMQIPLAIIYFIMFVGFLLSFFAVIINGYETMFKVKNIGGE
ncbi:TRAP transporter small permease [Vibrio gazogenes]|uniref:TRAP transporter small permease protein n=1 Tax=Vibrio gazogenes DSM 21264 = NBRC 103151 TaxID=1123492 RepID=A0A1M4YSE0_VIBGA|nr:TRAP transporter small permease [Vibrio gazogenes]USP15078.1 TRAP transporter small permease [Vibrio gazogenes]SHF08537.1 TRAP-type C4-dicarboxylate transport system, small permease component [Vibrio gazogenes DSM 21264] [Vibrio gazogenes DSM 21264 = NBRC 103151]SJN56587.1 Tripartite ATP-independent periplasmic transporters, DctQ component [Vibrio gazogenes]